jgi:hypothetical protein
MRSSETRSRTAPSRTAPSRTAPSRTALGAYFPAKLVLPAAVALSIILSFPVIEASAQGMNLSGFRGVNSFRGPATTVRPGMTSNLARPGMTRIPGGSTTGNGKINRPGHGTNTGHRPGGKGPVIGRIPNGGEGGGTSNRPHLPRRPGGPGVIVAIPSGGPPSGVIPRTNFSSGGQPPSQPGNQLGGSGGSGVPPANERRYAPNEVVVELPGTPSNQVVEALVRRHRLTRLQSATLQLTNSTIYRWRIPDRRSVPAVIRALEAQSGVVAQPNYYASLDQAPQPSTTDSSEIEQYALAKLQMPQAHALSRGERVLIAVIDGGVDFSHPELAGTIVDSFDAIGSGDKVHPHGTAVVGAIVAQVRLKGTAPAAQILAVRAFGVSRDNTQGTTFSITTGIDWAVVRGARIINMSFAGARDPKILRHLAIAHEQGIVLVAAAGNEGPKAAPAYPAAGPNVIAVTATDENDNLFQASNRGNHIAVAAPGVNLLLPAPGAAYKMMSGTSFAAAEVSGAVALLLERKPDLDPDTVRKILLATARDLGPKGVDSQFGAGLVDAYRAVMSLEPPAVDTATKETPTAER